MAERFTAERYIADVLDGSQVCGSLVRAAVRRHVADLETGAERGLYFDRRSAKVSINFFSILRHWKGEYAGKPIRLEPWQQFIMWSLFGWKRADGTRRFRTVYLEVARKNGKTTFAAGIGLYMLITDGEAGAEIYTAATKRDQARIAHNDAKEMVKKSPQLKSMIRTFKDNLYHEKSSSKFEPLGSNSDSTDGLNIHLAIADEVHAWRTRNLWDKLDTATGSRRQPLMLAITTAGYDRKSLCYTLHDYTRKVNSGVVADDSWFGLIYAMDKVEEGEDPEYLNEGNWVKSNPNLGISKKWDDIRRKFGRAIAMPAALNAFLRLELNTWTQAADRWIAPEVWRKCGGPPIDEEALSGRDCYGGLDLSTTTDLSALVWYFPPLPADPDDPDAEEEPAIILPRIFCPEEAIHLRSRRDRVPYEAWLAAGYLIATPGNVIDYAWILDQVERDGKKFNIREIAFDRWGSTKIIQELQELGVTVAEFGQGFRSMSAPMKELQKLILSEAVYHGNNPILSWMADNVVATQDPSGNIKPDKAKSIEKIDGIVALIMGLDRSIRHEPVKESVYNKRGLRSV